MSPSPNLNRCESAELTCAYALQVLPTSEVPAIQAGIVLGLFLSGAVVGLKGQTVQGRLIFVCLVLISGIGAE